MVETESVMVFLATWRNAMTNKMYQSRSTLFSNKDSKEGDKGRPVGPV
jgi:hypothetical protein